MPTNIVGIKQTKFYIMRSKYHVKTQTQGEIQFDELPKDIYICTGLQDDEDRGLICWFGFDNGTCLIPFQTIDGKYLFSIDGNIIERSNGFKTSKN